MRYPIGEHQIRSHGLRHTRSNGSSLIETIAGISLLLSTLAFVLDFAIVYLSYDINTATCREAARAACATLPSKSDGNGKVSNTSPIYRAAQSAINEKTCRRNAWISEPSLQSIEIQGLRFSKTENFSTAIDGIVTVRCAITVSPPISIPTVIPATVMLNSSCSYPMTCVSDAEGR